MTNLALLALLAAILFFQISFAQPGNVNQPPQPPQPPQQQSPPATMDLRLTAAVIFTAGVFLVFPATVLTMRYWFGLERSANHPISDEEVPLMWFKWAVVIAVSGFLVFGLPFLLPLYIGVYMLAGLGGLVLVYLFIAHFFPDTAARETRPRTRLTAQERNRLVQVRIQELRRRQGQASGQDQRGSAWRKAPEFMGVPPEVIDTFPFRIWAPQPIFNTISTFSQASVADNDVPSSKMESHRPPQLQLQDEGNLPGSVASPSAANKVPAEADPNATNLASPAFKQRPGSRILSVLNRPVKSRLFSISFSKRKIAPIEDGPCPICLEGRCSISLVTGYCR
jgi:hypothetical protein